MTETTPPLIPAAALWRRLDVPGHDACHLLRRADGWLLEGMAVFRHGAGAARLEYSVVCDESWRALGGDVRGWLGADAVRFHIERAAAGAWMLDGRAHPGLGRFEDLDFGFTPATNLQQLRRIGLAVGESAEVSVAWLDVERGTLEELPQRYERRSEDTYWYESPSVGYTALLEVDAAGFVRRYPGLWEAER